MSLKVYSGIKFHSKSMPEIISQLHSIAKQAKKNSSEYFINNPLISMCDENSVDEIFNTRNDPKGRTYLCYDLLKILRNELNNKWRRAGECNFKLEVTIIPWTDGNVYGIIYDDDIKANRELILSIADDYHYQNQTDKPDDISDEDWNEREKLWNEIFNKYYTPAEAGPLYTIVDSFDLDVKEVREMLCNFDNMFFEEKGYNIFVKSDLSVEKLNDIDFVNQINSSSDYVDCSDYIGWYEKEDTDYIIFCKTREDRDNVISFLNKQDHITIKKEKETYVRKSRFEKN